MQSTPSRSPDLRATDRGVIRRDIPIRRAEVPRQIKPALPRRHRTADRHLVPWVAAVGELQGGLEHRIVQEDNYLPGDLRRRINGFVEHYNHRRCCEIL